MAANEFAAKLGIRAGQRACLDSTPAEFAAERPAGWPLALPREAAA